MAEDKAAAPQSASERSNPPPTLSGYRAYADTMGSSDHARKKALEKDRNVEFHENLLIASAIGQYHRLYLTEQRLRDHAGGDNYLSRMKSFMADVRDNQLPRLNDARERRSAFWHIKSEYEQWGRDRKDLHRWQRAAFDRQTEFALRKRQEFSETAENPDTTAFFARQEVVERYAAQHEELNARVQREITGYIDRGVERQLERNRQSMTRSEEAAFEEIIGRPREHGRTRDKGPERGL